MPTHFVTLCTRSWYQSQAPRQPLQGPRDDDLKGVVARELGRVLVLRHVVPLAFVLALVFLSSRRCRSSNSNSSSSSSGRLSTRKTRRAFHQESHPRRRRLVLDFYSSKCSHPRDANLNNNLARGDIIYRNNGLSRERRRRRHPPRRSTTHLGEVKHAAAAVCVPQAVHGGHVLLAVVRREEHRAAAHVVHLSSVRCAWAGGHVHHRRATKQHQTNTRREED